MALSTFGAIMGFAAELAGHAQAAYDALAHAARDSGIKSVLVQLAGEEQKNHSLMERTRREHVTEMILEPIAGLFKKDYDVQVSPSEQKSDEDLLGAAVIIEARQKRFFDDAAAKIPLPEVARIFRKVAKKKAENLEKLQALRPASR